MNDLFAVAAGWGVIALGVAGLYLFGRDPKADEHDVSDYRPRARAVDEPNPAGEPAPVPLDVVFLGPHDPVPPRRNWPLIDREPVTAREALRPAEARTAPVETAAWDVPWRPPYAELVIAQALRRYGDNSSDVAARWLREVGEDARAKAGIRPSYATADRDMTGAFPVVRAA